MNPQRKKLIILAAVGVVALIFIFKAVFSESETDRLYRENFQKAERDRAAGNVPGGPAAPGAPTGAATSGAGQANGTGAGPSRSQFQKAEVDIDALIASIKEVDFDYELDRARINPMTPLVGPMAPMRLAVPKPGEEGQATTQEDVQMLIRGLRVTGILWDKRDPMAVINEDIVSRGFVFPDTGVKVHDIEKNRVILNVNNVLVPLEMEER
ncbi:MAG: hypothetical protein WC655_26980 [Candidatus Hydrogenedentales bacterium]|jgi:hypothetical protein